MEHIRRLFLAMFYLMFAVWMPGDASPALPSAAVPDCTPLVYEFDGPAGTDPPGWTEINADWILDGVGNTTSPGVLNEFSSIAAADVYADFAIEVRMQRDTDQHRTNAVFVRGEPLPPGDYKIWSRGYFFAYQNDGDVGVWRLDDSGAVPLLDWTPHPSVLANGYNLLRVDLIGSQMKFSINGKFVALIEDDTYASGKIGVGFYLTEPYSGPLYVDRVTISCNPNLLDPIVYLPAVFQASPAQAHAP
jgi:hypothetical protein